jgi:hypothetical protein
LRVRPSGPQLTYAIRFPRGAHAGPKYTQEASARGAPPLAPTAISAGSFEPPPSLPRNAIVRLSGDQVGSATKPFGPAAVTISRPPAPSAPIVQIAVASRTKAILRPSRDQLSCAAFVASSRACLPFASAIHSWTPAEGSCSR